MNNSIGQQVGRSHTFLSPPTLKKTSSTNKTKQQFHSFPSSISFMSSLLSTYSPTKILLQIDPDLANGTYAGRVKIDYQFTDETSEIRIQASKDFQWTSIRMATFYQFNEGYPVCKFLLGIQKTRRLLNSRCQCRRRELHP